MSPRVARALRELGFNVQHVGGDGQPRTGADDESILELAKRARQTIVTHNHDMVVICAEAGEAVVWVDPMDKDMTRTAQTLMCFGQIADWQHLLETHDGRVCVHARKTKCRPLDLDSAKRLAIERGKRLRRKMTAHVRPAPQSEALPGTDGE